MGQKVEELLERALELTEEDRLQLAEALLSSLGPPDSPPFDPEWLTEAKRRAARIDAGEGQLSSWQDVREHARRHLEGQAGG